MAQWNLAAKLFSLKRFSLRTGLIAFILLGVGMGVAGRWIQDVRKRGAAQRRVIGKCSEFTSTYYRAAFLRAPETKVSWLTTQLRYWVDAEYGHQNAALHISGDMLNDESTRRDLELLMAVDKVSVTGVYPPEHLVAVFRIPGLKQVAIVGVILAEEDSTDWSGVTAARSLETIDFARHYLSDELASQLAKLPKLRNIRNTICSAEALVSLAETQQLTELIVSGGAWRYVVEDDGGLLSKDAERAYFHDCGKRLFARLAKRKELKTLSLHSSLHLEPADLAEFCQSSPVTELTLVDAYLKPECLAEFAKLPHLHKLTLTEDQIEDRNLTALASAQQLLQLDIRGNTTTEGIARLRELLPNTTVNGQRSVAVTRRAKTKAAAR